MNHFHVPLRLCSFGALFALVAGANAQWMFTNLHPPGAAFSYAFGGRDGQQVGQYGMQGNLTRAAMWTGNHDSLVDLHPERQPGSVALAAVGGRQGGSTWDGGVFRAALWDDNAASFLSLEPAGSGASEISGMYGSKQVGTARFNGQTRAGFWQSTAASWVDLHPLTYSHSFALGIYDNQVVGYIQPNIAQFAALWTGTAASVVNLNPAGAATSRAMGVYGGQQVGYAEFDGTHNAGLWNGTAASWVNLNPAGSTWSEASATIGTLQAGTVQLNGLYRASLWSGTAASRVDMHPAGFMWSFATGIWQEGTDTFVVGWAQKASGERNAIMWSRPGPNSYLFTLSKSKVAGMNSVEGTITLGEAKPNATTFTTWDNSQLVTTPASVTVPAGQISKSFQISVTPMSINWPTMIYAKLGNVTRSRTLTLIPLIPTALSFTPNPVTGGQAVTGKVVINGVAGPNGLTLAIFDDSIYTTLPSTVTIPAGTSSVSFPITTATVPTTQTVTLTARNSAGEKSATFRIYQ